MKPSRALDVVAKRSPGSSLIERRSARQEARACVPKFRQIAGDAGARLLAGVEHGDGGDTSELWDAISANEQAASGSADLGSRSGLWGMRKQLASKIG